jgi:CO/xanthine dehydrogenase Mo-binding subunit
VSRFFCGKVDLGTGARTALAQMAAEELGLPFDRVEMVMGDTATTPDQWLTAGNLTIFQGGSELRRAAASARRALVERSTRGSPSAQTTGFLRNQLGRAQGVCADRSRKARHREADGQDTAYLQEGAAVLTKFEIQPQHFAGARPQP